MNGTVQVRFTPKEKDILFIPLELLVRFETRNKLIK